MHQNKTKLTDCSFKRPNKAQIKQECKLSRILFVESQLARFCTANLPLYMQKI